MNFDKSPPNFGNNNYKNPNLLCRSTSIKACPQSVSVSSSLLSCFDVYCTVLFNPCVHVRESEGVGLTKPLRSYYVYVLIVSVLQSYLIMTNSVLEIYKEFGGLKFGGIFPRMSALTLSLILLHIFPYSHIHIYSLL